MKLKRIYITAIIVLIASKFNFSHAQNLSNAIQKADSLIKANDIDAAYHLYDRIWFFAEPIYQQQITLTYLDAAFKSQHFNRSLYLINTLKNRSESMLGSDQKLLEVASHFNLENWEDCLNSVDHYLADSLNELEANLYYFKLLCELKLGQKDSVQNTAQQLKKFANLAKQKELDSILFIYQNAQFVSLKKAQIGSLILPGLGQLYQKNYSNAANAFILNGSLMGAFLLTSHFYNWPQAALFWVYYIPHYYLGNAKSSKDLAIEKNKKTSESTYQMFQNWNPN